MHGCGKMVFRTHTYIHKLMHTYGRVLLLEDRNDTSGASALFEDIIHQDPAHECTVTRYGRMLRETHDTDNIKKAVAMYRKVCLYTSLCAYVCVYTVTQYEIELRETPGTKALCV
jgi:hypothetical protein